MKHHQPKQSGSTKLVLQQRRIRWLAATSFKVPVALVMNRASQMSILATSSRGMEVTVTIGFNHELMRCTPHGTHFDVLARVSFYFLIGLSKAIKLQHFNPFPTKAKSTKESGNGFHCFTIHLFYQNKP